MTQSNTPSSKRLDEGILAELTLSYGPQLEGLSRKQKLAFVSILVSELSPIQDLIDVPPYLSDLAVKLSEDGCLSLIETVIAQLKLTK